MLFEVLSKYATLTLYYENRSAIELMFCQGACFDQISISEIDNRYINIKEFEGEGFCLIRRNLNFTIKNLEFNRDEVTIFAGDEKIHFFCKKKTEIPNMDIQCDIMYSR